VDTEFAEVANREPRGEKPRSGLMHVAVEKVAQSGLSAIEQDTALIIPGLAMRIVMAVTRALPLSAIRVALRFISYN
jgi:short-subunit dehydrogenase